MDKFTYKDLMQQRYNRRMSLYTAIALGVFFGVSIFLILSSI